MTAREWLESPDGRKVMKKRGEEIMKNLLPQMEPVLKIAREVIKPVTVIPPALRAPDRYATPNTPRFIEYRNGDIYVRGKLVDFPDPTADYVLFVKVLHLHSDSNGFLSYENISRFLEKETGKRSSGKRAQQKRILNAVANLYRKRERQKNAFPKQTPDGAPAIQNVPGKGFIIRSP